MHHATADQIADALGVDRRRVFEYVRAGMPKLGPGRFDENACLRWMVRHQAELIKRGESETSSKSADAVRRQRARLVEAHACDAEIDLAERRGELIPLELFRSTMSGMILTARQQLLQLPGRVAGELEGEPRHVIKHKLTLAVHAALTALSQGPPADPVGEPHEPGNGSNGHGNNDDGAAGPVNGKG